MSLTMNGTTDIISYGDNFDIGAVGTYMVWVNPSALAATRMIFSKFNTGVSGEFALFTTAGTSGMNFRALNGGTADGATADSLLVVGTWLHVAVVYDGGGAANADKVKIYVNGVNQALSFSGTFQASYAGTAQAFQVAQDVGGNSGLAGDYAHFRYWDAALTLGEIQAEAFMWRPRRWQNLQVWSPFDDGLGGGDFSGNGKTATLTNTTAAVTAPPINYGGQSLHRKWQGFRTGFTRRYLSWPGTTLQAPQKMWFGGLVK